MKKILNLSLLLFLPMPAAFACIHCNREVQHALYESMFYPNPVLMLLAFWILGVIVIFFARQSVKVTLQSSKEVFSPVPLRSAATVLGIGFGGFFDGIVFHMLLQWHEMLSNKIPPLTLTAKTVNMFWDGIFHVFAFLATLTGIILLGKLLHRTDFDRSNRLITGGILAGWGIFNLVEGVINHQILKLHNVNDFSPHPDTWNYGFLAFGVVLILLGRWMAR